MDFKDRQFIQNSRFERLLSFIKDICGTSVKIPMLCVMTNICLASHIIQVFVGDQLTSVRPPPSS